MKRVVFYRYGGPEVMQLEEVPIPQPGRREVLVKMIATSINGADLIQRRGTLTINNKFPKTVGLDVVGKVVKLGANVKEYQLGDLVWGNVNVRTNAAAEYVSCPVKNIQPLPARIDPVEAAALPTTMVTAITVLVDKGHLKAGERVLVRGIGGVGLAAVQVASAFGGEVVALGSQNSQAATRYGAAEVFDYHQTPLSKLGSFDLIVDTVGSDLDKFRALLKPQGRLLTVSTNFKHPFKSLADILLSLRYGRQRTRIVIGYPTKKRLRLLNRLVEAGKAQPVVDSIYPLTQIKEANQRADQHGIFGKIILQIGN